MKIVIFIGLGNYRQKLGVLSGVPDENCNFHRVLRHYRQKLGVLSGVPDENCNFHRVGFISIKNFVFHRVSPMKIVIFIGG